MKPAAVLAALAVAAYVSWWFWRRALPWAPETDEEVATASWDPWLEVVWQRSAA